MLKQQLTLRMHVLNDTSLEISLCDIRHNPPEATLIIYIYAVYVYVYMCVCVYCILSLKSISSKWRSRPSLKTNDKMNCHNAGGCLLPKYDYTLELTIVGKMTMAIMIGTVGWVMCSSHSGRHTVILSNPLLAISTDESAVVKAPYVCG